MDARKSLVMSSILRKNGALLRRFLLKNGRGGGGGYFPSDLFSFTDANPTSVGLEPIAIEILSVFKMSVQFLTPLLVRCHYTRTLYSSASVIFKCLG